MNSEHAKQMVMGLYELQRKIKAIKEQHGGFGDFSKYMREAEFNLIHAIGEVKAEEERQEERQEEKEERKDDSPKMLPRKGSSR